MMSRQEEAEAVMSSYPRHDFMNNDTDGETTEFSWSNCELCGGLPGERFPVIALVIGSKDNEEERIDFSACGDCMYYIEYGEGPLEYYEER